ncbi:MAG: hypothetical protein EKK41_16925 [Hyphomicrobiales bacterium]|nr:MAG: hypothetical protein EKK41_16925 [Hyphomicrobiales bacterium]
MNDARHQAAQYLEATYGIFPKAFWVEIAVFVLLRASPVERRDAMARIAQASLAEPPRQQTKTTRRALPLEDF